MRAGHVGTVSLNDAFSWGQGEKAVCTCFGSIDGGSGIAGYLTEAPYGPNGLSRGLNMFGL